MTTKKTEVQSTFDNIDPRAIPPTAHNFAPDAKPIPRAPENAIVVAADGATEIVAARDSSPRIVDGLVVFSSMRDVMSMSRHYIRAGMVPRSLEGRSNAETESRVAVAIEFGMGLGFSPLQSLAAVMIVNNRPCLWGDAPVALVMRHKAYGGQRVEFVGENDKLTCVYTVIRKIDGAPVEFQQRFGIEDAKRAGLWGKSGPWTQYPKRMMQIRARAFALRDAFADALAGAGIAEELEDTGDTQTAALQRELDSIGGSRGVDQNAN